MTGLQQLLLTSCILFSVATLTTAVPFDRQGLSSNLYTKKNDSLDSENVCMIDDMLYQVGDAIPTASPCEKCVCQPPGFACSIITCEKRPNCRALQRSNQCCPEYKCDCEHDGKVYHNGEKLDNIQNPCKVCFCQGGEIACTVIECYKRDDCVPKQIPGMCCPKYDNCPPRDPARPVSSSFGPPVQPTNSTEAREAPKFREVADDRLNLLGEPEATNQPLPEQPISNIIYNLPQGDDPQAYEAYDDSSTSTSTTGFILYDDGLTSSTTPIYNSYEEISSDLGSNSSTTEGSTPWTNFPTFPKELLPTGYEWSLSTSSSTQDGSTEFIPTWGNYTAPTDSSTQSTSTTEWNFETDDTTQSTYSTDETTSGGTSTFSTQDPFQNQKTSVNYSTENWFVSSSTDSSTVETTFSTDETFTNTILDMSSLKTATLSSVSMSGSGDGEVEAQTSNCISGSEDYNCVDLTSILENFNASTHSTDTDSSISLEHNTDTRQQEYSSTSDSEVSTQNVTASQEVSSGSTDFSPNARTSEPLMAGDMAPSDQETSIILTDIWNFGDQSTTENSTTILPDATDLKSNKTMESIKVGPSDANGTLEESSTLNDDSSSKVTTDSSSTVTTDSSSTVTTDSSLTFTTDSSSTVTTDSSSTFTTDGSSTVTTDSSSTATTESSTRSSTGGEYETGTTGTEMSESTISTVVTDTETSTSSSLEASTTQTSETTTQAIEAETDSTTMEMSS